LTLSNPSIGRFLLTNRTAEVLSQQCHIFFSDCPDVTFSLLELLSIVLKSSPEFHSAIVLSSFYSFPHDVLHKISGDILCFSAIPNRSEFEQQMVIVCLSVISSFFAFPCRLGAEELTECLTVFHQNVRSSKSQIQREAFNGLANFFRTNCGFGITYISIESITEIIIEYIENDDPFVRYSTIEIAQSIALFPDKRNGRFLLDRDLLNFLRFDGQTVDCKSAGISLILAFLQHDGELITIVLKSSAAKFVLQLLGDEPYGIRLLAFQFCVSVLKFPQSVEFVIQNVGALTVAMEFLEAADEEEVKGFLKGMELLLFYANGLGVLEKVREVILEIGFLEILPEILERDDLEWKDCNLGELIEGLGRR
jgi:hypothetical protein